MCRYVKDKVITQLEVAFSREQAHKVYVTHRLEQQGEAVWRCIDKGGYLYVCGCVKCAGHGRLWIRRRLPVFRMASKQMNGCIEVFPLLNRALTLQ
jgi:hypothetical protein